MEALLSKTIKNNQLEDFDLSKLADVRLIGIYLAASYCPPSISFTKQLTEFYLEVNRGKYQFEIFLIPLDTEEEQFKAFFKEMPWCCFPFNDPHNKEFILRFMIKGIPKLLIFDTKGNLISENARKEISLYQDEAFDLWLKRI